MTVESVAGLCPGISPVCRPCSVTGYTEEQFLTPNEVQELINITSSTDDRYYDTKVRVESFTRADESACRIYCQARNYCKGYNFSDENEENCKLIFMNLNTLSGGPWDFLQNGFETFSYESEMSLNI